jgi:hypothetical protein
MSPSPRQLWDPPQADERGRPPRAPRGGWLACAFGACLLVGAVAVEAKVGSVGSTAPGVRLPSGATSVTAEPSVPDPGTTIALGEEAPATTELVTSTTSVTSATASTVPLRSGPARTTSAPSVELPGALDPSPTPTTGARTTPTTTQVTTVTTPGRSSPPPTNAASSSSTVHPPTTTVTSVTATTTTTAVARFDPTQCANPFYFLMHRAQCRVLLPPSPSTTSTTHPRDD